MPSKYMKITLEDPVDVLKSIGKVEWIVHDNVFYEDIAIGIYNNKILYTNLGGELDNGGMYLPENIEEILELTKTFSTVKELLIFLKEHESGYRSRLEILEKDVEWNFYLDKLEKVEQIPN